MVVIVKNKSKLISRNGSLLRDFLEICIIHGYDLKLGSGNSNANGNQSDGMANNKPTKSRLSGKGILISAGRVWRFITVEPLMLCWLLPSCFLFIAVENLALEKVRDTSKMIASKFTYVCGYHFKLYLYMFHHFSHAA